MFILRSTIVPLLFWGVIASIRFLVAYIEDLSDLSGLAAAEDEPTRDYEEFLAEMG
jgi:hypothetical protein